MEFQTTNSSTTFFKQDLFELLDIQKFNKQNSDQKEISEKALLQEMLSSYHINPTFQEFILKNSYLNNNLFCLDESTIKDINLLKENHFETIITNEAFNLIHDINMYIEQINTKLKDGGILLGYYVDGQRNVYSFKASHRLLKKQYKLIHNARSIWNFCRNILKKVSFMSKAEFFGRLSCYGYEIQDELSINNKLYFAATKKKSPLHIKKNQHGFFIKLPRVCKSGKIKYFYKIRTMYPYSEYLQEYIWKVQGLMDGGKINSDFRVSGIGKFLRKFWIDELPMLYNFLRGDIKLVGVRPLSKHYFGLYTKELQNMRIKTKPGLIPPFYVDFPRSLDEIMESEKKYLLAYENHPIKTDLSYLIKALINILFKGYRSN
jgi:lipopolysaccharide/colanic/teichoic acid biosynthesis glycosyltransferase